MFDAAIQAETREIRFEIPGVHPDQIQPVGFASTANGSSAFMALWPSNHVAVMDALTYKVEAYILVGRRVWRMAFSADGSKLFTTNGVSGDVTVIDVAAREAVQSIKVGCFPWGVAARP